MGINSYTVDTATGIILYRLADGAHVLHNTETADRAIAPAFSEQRTMPAVRDNQQGKTDYPGFMDAIAAAGVHLYEATLAGNHKRVTYIGRDGSYQELISSDL